MCYPKKNILVLLALLMATAATAHDTIRPITSRIIVKSNLLSLIAQKPTITVEKVLSKTFSMEVSFVQGQFNNFLFTDHYDYNGLLIRAKKYFINLDYGNISPYAAVYAGTLKRNIQTEGQSGWLGYPSRDFSSNSIRGGGSLGIAYIGKSKFTIDGLGSLGYGRYLNLDKSDPNTYFSGYLDVQIWLSVGYCF